MNHEKEYQNSQDVKIVQIPRQIIQLPFDVNNELNQYSKVFVTKEFNVFRNFHFLEGLGRDYRVFGELPDGDKKILFTSQLHFQCCNFCDDCALNFCCCEYLCCNRIVVQMDYKRNNKNFYTQGFNIQKGFYCCTCYCCFCCNFKSHLYLRENIDPNNPDFNVGIKKGFTAGTPQCFSYIRDREASYTNEMGVTEYTVRLPCCEACRMSLSRCYCCNFKDIEMSIEDVTGKQVGTIVIPDGCCSKRVEGDFCYLPGRCYEINFPPNISSLGKFQIISSVIHFDLENMII